MTGEVVGAQLVAGHQAVLDEVLDPGGERVEVLAHERGVLVGEVGGCRHDEHVTALLDGHLVLHKVHVRNRREAVDGRIVVGNVELISHSVVGEVDDVLAALLAPAVKPVDLSAAVRIGACVVRSKVVVPHGHIVELVNRAHHALDELGVVYEVQRNGRIAYVHGGDAAVGVVFLGQEQHVALLILDELVRAHRLTEPCVQHEQVILAVLFGTLFKVAVERVELLHYRVVFAIRIRDCVVNRLAFLEPIALEPIAEVGNRHGVVERVGELAAHGFIHVLVLAERRDILVAALPADELRLAGEQEGRQSLARHHKRFVAGQVPISPLCRARIISLRHYELFFESEPGALAFGELDYAASDGHRHAVVAGFLVHEQTHGHIAELMLGLHLVVHIAHGAGQKREVVRRQRRGKAHSQIERVRGKLVLGRKRRQRNLFLLQLLRAGDKPHKRVSLAVGVNRAQRSPARARPEYSVAAVELVGR